MSEEEGLFTKARGYVIRGHELAMGLTIAGLCALVAFLAASIVVIHPSTVKYKSDAAYKLGYDIGVFCGSDAQECSIICINNLEREYLVADCTRGVINGNNAKNEFPVRNYVERPSRK